jgi:hypothetical protein
MAETSGDSSRGVSGILFRGIHDSFTTQGLPQKRAETSRIRPSPASSERTAWQPSLKPKWGCNVDGFYGEPTDALRAVLP